MIKKEKNVYFFFFFLSFFFWRLNMDTIILIAKGTDEHRYWSFLNLWISMSYWFCKHAEVHVIIKQEVPVV